MIARDAELAVETVENDPVPTRVRALGEWTFAGLKTRREEILRTLDDLRRIPPRRVAWDLTPIADLDDTGALWLARAMRGAVQVEASVQQREILDRVAQGSRVRIAMERPTDPYAPVVAIGEAALHFGAHLRDATVLLGRVVLEAGALAWRPRDAVARTVGERLSRGLRGAAGDDAGRIPGRNRAHVPFRAAAQALRRRSARHQHRRRRRSARAGADARVDHRRGPLGLGDDRATRCDARDRGDRGAAGHGRLDHHAARAAEGDRARDRRCRSLVLHRPCGARRRARRALHARHSAAGVPRSAAARGVEPVNFWIGIGKSGAFGFAVAFVACHYGLKVLPNTDSLAAGVTGSVVASITCVIILDAIFAILLRNVG